MKKRGEANRITRSHRIRRAADRVLSGAGDVCRKNSQEARTPVRVRTPSRPRPPLPPPPPTTLWALLKKKKRKKKRKKKKNVLFNVAALLCFATLLKWLVGSNRVNLVGQSHCSQWRVKAISAARRGAHQNTHRDWTKGGSESESAFSRWRSQILGGWGGGWKCPGHFPGLAIMGIYPLLAY